MFEPITELLSWIPLIGWLLSDIVGFADLIIALIVGTITFFLVDALAWIRYRQMVG